ncbi:unnamed protein product, partial [Heterosigma akashiwo]
PQARAGRGGLPAVHLRLDLRAQGGDDHPRELGRQPGPHRHRPECGGRHGGGFLAPAVPRHGPDRQLSRLPLLRRPGVLHIPRHLHPQPAVLGRDHLQVPGHAHAGAQPPRAGGAQVPAARADRPQLDLRCVRHMINGAEPIDRLTLDRFQATFEKHGLPPGVVFPTYGLAEHTVYVCSNGRQRITVDKLALETRREVVLA